jgi:uncharacterized SAM-binding protein YcdF (DUF218 family)
VRRLVTVAVGLVLLVLLVAASLRLFVWPPTSSVPARADAVALLSGGAGDRLPKAQGLTARGVASVLVIPNGHDPKWAAANRLCSRPQTFEVLCPDPAPNTTRGEAEAIGRLAADRGWRRVVVVTSRYHVTRAGVLLRRCVHGSVAIVGSTPQAGVVSWTEHVVHEWGGLASAMALHRAC